MFSSLDVIKTLFETFDGSAVRDLQAYLHARPHVRKWIVSADFCLRDPGRPNSAFAFTLIPYDADLEEMQADIDRALPRDLKKTKQISESGLLLMASDRWYHVVFVFPKHPDLFFSEGPANRVGEARSLLRQWLETLANLGRSDEQLKDLRALHRRSMAATFNVGLLSDLILLSYLFCFVTLALWRERPDAKVSWFPDRDRMTTWEGGVIWDLALESLEGVAEALDIAHSERSIGIGVPPDMEGGKLWFDALVRLSDYVAGLFSSLDLESRTFAADKHRQLATQFSSGTKNLVAVKVACGEIFQASRLLLFSEPPRKPAA